jgi:ketosteroid isomerase-like protein
MSALRCLARRLLPAVTGFALLTAGAVRGSAQSVPGVDNIDWNRQNVTFTADALRSFNDVVARWSTALRDGDAKKASDLYSLGATVAFTANEMVRGRDGVHRILATRVGDGIDIRVSATDIVSSGDVISATGPFVVETGEDDMVTGTYSMMLRLEQGRWRIRSQVFTPSIPLRDPVAADSTAETQGQ